MKLIIIGLAVITVSLTIQATAYFVFQYFRDMGWEERLRETYVIGNQYSESVGGISLSVWNVAQLVKVVTDPFILGGAGAVFTGIAMVVADLLA